MEENADDEYQDGGERERRGKMRKMEEEKDDRRECGVCHLRLSTYQPHFPRAHVHITAYQQR